MTIEIWTIRPDGQRYRLNSYRQANAALSDPNTRTSFITTFRRHVEHDAMRWREMLPDDVVEVVEI